MKRCVYCNSRGGETTDHCVPQSLFPKSERQGITKFVGVPACRRCNNGFSVEDEAFRRTLVFRSGVDEQRYASVIRSALDGLADLNKRCEFFKSVENKDLITQSGLYLGNHFTYEADTSMMCRMADRVIQGLHYKEFKRRINPLRFRIRSVLLDGCDLEKSRKDFILNVAVANIRSFKKTFIYSFMRPKDKLSASVWVSLFYETTAFLTFVMPHQ